MALSHLCCYVLLLPHQDLLFTYRAFYGPLPETLVEFKEKFNELFPVVYDNKYVVSREDMVKRAFADTTVEGLYHSVRDECKWNKVVLGQGFEVSSSTYEGGEPHAKRSDEKCQMGVWWWWSSSFFRGTRTQAMPSRRILPMRQDMMPL